MATCNVPGCTKDASVGATFIMNRQRFYLCWEHWETDTEIKQRLSGVKGEPDA